MATVILEKCTGCNICIPYCPVGAISPDAGRVLIDQVVCTECGVCYRNPICPKHALLPGPFETFGDTFKHVLSDPTVTVEATGITGRGTEECKTNDVTGRYPRHRVGFTIDMGRPGIGVFLRDVETVAQALVAAGLELEPPDRNPLASIFEDLHAPRLKEGLSDVHLLSVIIEGTCSLEDMDAVLEALKAVQYEVNTVFSVGMVVRVDPSGYHPALEKLERHGIPRPLRGKVNVGLGRPLVDI